MGSNRAARTKISYPKKPPPRLLAPPTTLDPPRKNVLVVHEVAAKLYWGDIKDEYLRLSLLRLHCLMLEAEQNRLIIEYIRVAMVQAERICTHVWRGVDAISIFRSWENLKALSISCGSEFDYRQHEFIEKLFNTVPPKSSLYDPVGKAESKIQTETKFRYFQIVMRNYGYGAIIDEKGYRHYLKRFRNSASHHSVSEQSFDAILLTIDARYRNTYTITNIKQLVDQFLSEVKAGYLYLQK